MRIGIEAQRIFRKKKHGMDIVALELIKALQLIDQTNQYFIFVKRGEDNACLAETPNFKIIEVPGLTYADWEQVFLPLYIRKYKVDVLHCTSNTAPVFCSAPTIITLHDVIFLENSGTSGQLVNWYQQLGRIYRKYIVPTSVKQTRRIITVSHYEKGKIAGTLKVDGDKISVLYNAFGKHFSKPDNRKVEEIRIKYKLPEQYIFYIGNTEPKKNMTNTLMAYIHYARETKDHLPLVVADVSERNLELLLEKLQLQQYRKHIQLTGYIHNSDLPFIYAGAKVFLYPSLRESFGIPVLESMACGTPVITSNTSALPEVAGSAALLVNPSSQVEITRALSSSLGNESLRQNLIAKGFERIREFSWNLSATNLLTIYKTI